MCIRDRLKELSITTSVRGNWDDCVLEALDGQYGLEDPQEVQLLRMTQYLMERMDPATIDWLRSLPMLEKKEVDELRFSLSHNLPNKNYGGDLLVENDTEKFDQLLDDEVDVAVYGHVHKQLLRYGLSLIHIFVWQRLVVMVFWRSSVTLRMQTAISR